MLPNFLYLLAIAFPAGILGAMTGIGGGIILIPVLTLIGIPIKYAIAASIMSTIATSSGSASAYVRDRLSNVRIGMYLEMFTVPGAVIGATIAVILPSKYDFILFFTFAAVLLISWWQLLTVKRSSELPYVEKQDRASKWLTLHGVYFDKVSEKWIYYKSTHALEGGSAMFGVGMLAGLLGIGAGALKVTVMDLIMNLSGKVSTTTSNFIIGVTALAGSSVFIAAGLVNVGIVAPVMIGVTAGAFLGTKFLVKMRNVQVRYMFLFILLGLAIEMILRGAGVLP
ncbi:MAG: sulfite exporter TauE/SafE family protein [Thermoplasmata archaeon]|nr:sulfite exporter TauE/SafE family protein [Candidatus Sysuiplasma acidicola]MBX8646050.1 sulfite exporter TauE/SafE family protein [Candidatus Sysuiplasma acidicola]